MIFRFSLFFFIIASSRIFGATLENTNNEGKIRTSTPDAFLTIGGFGNGRKASRNVYKVDMNTQQSCLHSKLPVLLKEAHVYEFEDTILACSTFIGRGHGSLQCFKWSGSSWEEISGPTENFRGKFISSVKVPNVGIFFMGGKDGNSLILNDNGEWSPGPQWTHVRSRSCAVLISETKVAHIGGAKGPEEPVPIGHTIDTFDFTNPDSPVEATNITQLNSYRKHHSCALIPKGQNGNPTVAILGDNSPPFIFYMELWDTVTNIISMIPHPEGFENSRFFRPVIATLDDNSIILLASRVHSDGGISFLTELFKYEFGTGWTKLGPIEPALEPREQLGVYILNNPGLGKLNSLNNCSA